MQPRRTWWWRSLSNSGLPRRLAVTSRLPSQSPSRWGPGAWSRCGSHQRAVTPQARGRRATSSALGQTHRVLDESLLLRPRIGRVGSEGGTGMTELRRTRTTATISVVFAVALAGCGASGTPAPAATPTTPAASTATPKSPGTSSACLGRLHRAKPIDGISPGGPRRHPLRYQAQRPRPRRDLRDEARWNGTPASLRPRLAPGPVS